VSEAEQMRERARAIELAVAGQNDNVWAVFLYGCSKCKHIEPIGMGVGVEGPKSFRDAGLFIPSPFGGPACEKCGGDTTHVFWNQDEQFEPRPPPPGRRYFRVPPKGINMRYFESSGFCGDTVRVPS
jgi:hypothetical protein